MKKKIAILLLAAISCSCGASKKIKEIDKTKETETVKEVFKDTSKIEITNKIEVSRFVNIYGFEPFDNSKPYFVNGKKYENVRIINKQENTNYKQDLKTLEQRYINNAKVLTKQIEALKTIKTKETKEPYFFYFIIVLLATFLYIRYS
jgi:hypothetical protein